MTTKSKKEIRSKLLNSLQTWHKELGIYRFPKRFGISTNEKKFREVSFRVKRGVEEKDADVDDIVLAKQPIFGLGHTIVGYTISYRVWLPTVDGKMPGQWTIRFSLHSGVVAVVKAGKYFINVEHDYFPLQRKAIGFPRMFGVTETQDIDTIGTIILTKEYPFMLEHVKDIKVKQLGKTLFIDPSSRYERTVSLLIELELHKDVHSKEELADYIDHRNKEMLLHHIYTEAEMKQILKDRMSIRSDKELVYCEGNEFIEQYSLWALAAYFASDFL